MDNRYLSLSELPYLQQLARRISYNVSPYSYQNDNSLSQYLLELGKIREAQNKVYNTPQNFNINLPKINWRQFFSGQEPRGPQTYNTGFSG